MIKPGQPHRGAHWGKIAVAIVVIPLAFGLSSCGAVSKAINAVKTVHNIMHGSAAINSLTSKISSGDNSAYDVTYVTTGNSPATVHYAAQPPHDFAFDTNTSTGDLEITTNASGEFECNRSSGSGSASTWTCLKLQGAAVSTDKLAYALYSGSYWIDFLKAYSVVAALQHVTIASSTMTVNGFALECAVVVSGTKPNQTTSKVCVTSQGILGYVSASAKSADFEIKSYSASPAASTFALPAGATVTTLPTTTTS
jgi:hypothetical protein